MSQERSLDDIQQQAEAAVFSARHFVNAETGVIVYDAFSPEQIMALYAGPGPVKRLAEQSPIHLQPDFFIPNEDADEDTGEEVLISPSSELFLRDYNNFRTRFRREGMYAIINAGSKVVQRFRILFPELDEAIVQYVGYREEVLMPNRPNAHGPLPVDGHYGPIMQFVYGIMAQLVDLDDPVSRDGTTVERSGGARVQLTI